MRFEYCHIRRNPEYDPTRMPATTNHGSVPNHRSAKYPTSVPDMIEAKNDPPSTQPSLIAEVT